MRRRIFSYFLLISIFLIKGNSSLIAANKDFSGTAKITLTLADIIIPADFDFKNIPVSYANSTWVISNVHDLKGASINIPSNVIFKFQGGRIENGTIKFNNSYLPNDCDFKSILFEGTVVYDEINLQNVGVTNNKNDDKRNASILYALLNSSHDGTIIIPEYDIYLSIATYNKADCKNKTIRGLSKSSNLILTSGGPMMFAENVIFENFTFDNGLATSFKDQWMLVGSCSDIVMRNIDFKCKERPFKLTPIEPSGKFENITIEYCNFLRSDYAQGGANPVLNFNVDGKKYDMNILIQHNYFEGGNQYWGEGGDNPDHATVDFSGSGVRVLNNIIVNSQYNGAINIEDCNGALIEVAHNTVYINNIPSGGAAPGYNGIALNGSTNVKVHHNNINGSSEMKDLGLSKGILCSIRTGDNGDVYIEDNKIDNVKFGIQLAVGSGRITSGHSYFIRRNQVSNFIYGQHSYFRESLIGNSVYVEDNTFFIDNYSDSPVYFAAESGVDNNTEFFTSGNNFDFQSRLIDFNSGCIVGPGENSSIKSLLVGENYVNNPNDILYNSIKKYNYSKTTPQDAEKYSIMKLNSYVSDVIDLSEGGQYLKSFLNLPNRQAIYDVSIQYVEASSSNTGIPIDIYFSTPDRLASQNSFGVYKTEPNMNINTVIEKNWSELGVKDYPNRSQNNLSIRCNRNKTGIGKVIITIRTFDLDLKKNNNTSSVTANAGSDVAICTGESTTLTASGGSSYVWSTGATTASITVSPNTTQTYTVTATDGSGNSDSDDVIVTVNSVTASAGADVTITDGESTTLSATGGDTYLWSTGATTKDITINPSQTQNYTVTASKNDCEDTDSVTVTVNPASSVTANAGSDVAICTGESATLNASGGSSYVWSTGATTASITVSPNTTQTYTVTATDGSGNSDSDDVIVTVNSVTASAGADVTITDGESATLSAAGGDTYLWSNGATTKDITINPSQTQNYTVTATQNGCEDTDSVTVTVNPASSVTANAGSDVAICTGESATLNASGGSSYVWSTGATTASITVSPNTTQTYTVTATDGSGNSDSDDVIVTVNSVTASAGADVTINEGDSVTLTANGGDSYLWNTGATTQSITVNPNSSTTYTVTVTANGCEDTDSVNVTVNQSSGSVTANAGSDVSICSGESATLTASGGSSYVWSTGATSQSITVSPTSTQTYTVSVTDSNGNSDSDDVVVTVNSLTANAGSDRTILEGETITLVATGGDSYIWNTGEKASSISVSPNSTRTYSVTAYKGSCLDTDQVRVTVESVVDLDPPSAQADAGEDMTICLGETIVLNGSGGETYLWSTEETSRSISVSPSRTTTYELTATRGGVTNMDSVTITVENCESAIISDEEDLAFLEMAVYPNPTQGELTIQIYNLEEDANFVINDTKGSLIYSDQIRTSGSNDIRKEIDLSSYVPGVYFLRLINSKDYLVKKIVVM